ncbi:hypothetical protein PN462_17045 [Spirulina sp. CS-785/01]|uniref:hypothetical protein n=1 Tax=Spirulina sp. CS-785/01 TaxID=3021716 RepID=UPI00232A85B4|nr:hypothetical protein [Spirulina sp. CS-785/01]MDB9314823.1 hypothetical protein [Spirulina sp. CS-785/01]
MDSQDREYEFNKNREYEFSQSQNSLIEDLANKMRFVAYFLIAISILAILGGLITILESGLATIMQGVVQLFVGIWTLNAASAFRRIVTTEGSDIENLMGALGELRKLYRLQYWLLVITLVAIVIIVLAFVVFGIILGVTSS